MELPASVPLASLLARLFLLLQVPSLLARATPPGLLARSPEGGWGPRRACRGFLGPRCIGLGVQVAELAGRTVSDPDSTSSLCSQAQQVCWLSSRAGFAEAAEATLQAGGAELEPLQAPGHGETSGGGAAGVFGGEVHVVREM